MGQSKHKENRFSDKLLRAIESIDRNFSRINLLFCASLAFTGGIFDLVREDRLVLSTQLESIQLMLVAICILLFVIIKREK
jgi:hypothetical protein